MRKGFKLIAVCMMVISCGVVYYNTIPRGVESSLFIENVEALSRNDNPYSGWESKEEYTYPVYTNQYNPETNTYEEVVSHYEKQVSCHGKNKGVVECMAGTFRVYS